MNEVDIQKKIIEKSGEIAKLLYRQKDCELRPDKTKGFKVLKVEKKEV